MYVCRIDNPHKRGYIVDVYNLCTFLGRVDIRAQAGYVTAMRAGRTQGLRHQRAAKPRGTGQLTEPCLHVSLSPASTWHSLSCLKCAFVLPFNSYGEKATESPESRETPPNGGGWGGRGDVSGLPNLLILLITTLTIKL